MRRTLLSPSERLALTHLRIGHRVEVACARIAGFVGRRHEGAAPTHVVARISEIIGGDIATSRIPESHPGTCAMFYSRQPEALCAVFPTYSEALVAARMAIDPAIGGYGDVVLDAGITATANATFFVSAAHWLD
ncbi:hypothetical protein FZ983_24210 [Azospirillum sp. B21]|uniref:hypothetical protein n=1 Tax=unclassified Azospirillum TaxID=2630922 RepID=UPI0011F01D13|nr:MULTISPECIES: hypothetical protein [unclassified Azospirillum]KAA0576162.1 hypothetical protein FZ983_24210 [Azospirillum sp. B21]MDR6774728.1 hypothetical protein [Azospirillum sp. BE72]